MLDSILNNDELKKLKSYNLVASPSWIHFYFKVCISLFLIILIICLFLPWTQTIKGKGQVIAFSPNERAQNIESPIYGRLGKWHVNEGSFVEKDDPIVEIVDNDPDILERLKAEREAMIKKFEAARLATETSKINVTRQKDLMEQGLSSKRDFEKARIEYTKFVSDEAKASAELTKIDTKIARQSTQSVVAPMSGYIQRRNLGRGSQLVKSGDFIALLVPNTESRAVEIWIDGNDAPFVHVGDQVRLQFEGWPAIQSFGWPSLAKGTFGATVQFIDPFVSQDGQTRLLLKPSTEDDPWPSHVILRQGTKVFGWALLNRVSLGYELWRNFNNFPPISSQEKLEKKYQQSKDKSL